MSKGISQQSIDVIKASACCITSNDVQISSRMYEILFEKYPKMQMLFANSPKNQHMKLANAISSYAVNIEKIHVLFPALEVIAISHVREDVKPAHYPLIGRAFIEAIEDVLGDDASMELLDAWREVYKYIADILIEMEEKLYLEQKEREK